MDKIRNKATLTEQDKDVAAAQSESQPGQTQFVENQSVSLDCVDLELCSETAERAEPNDYTDSSVTAELKCCLNCGESLAADVRFCPQCGQAADTGRLGIKAVALSSLGTITRLNKGVFYTCWNLMWRPWRVISGFIRGQRVNYTDPVRLLIGLCFIVIALKALFNLGEPTSIDLEFAGADAAKGGESPWLHIFKFFAESDTLNYLIVFLPVAPVIMFVNRKKGIFHYNFAECFVGSLYMSDAALILELMCLPVLAFGVDISLWVVLSYLAVMGTILIYKSLRHFDMSRGRRILKVSGTLLLMLLSYVLIFLLLTIIVTLIILLTHPDSLTTP